MKTCPLKDLRVDLEVVKDFMDNRDRLYAKMKEEIREKDEEIQTLKNETDINVLNKINKISNYFKCLFYIFISFICLLRSFLDLSYIL